MSDPTGPYTPESTSERGGPTPLRECLAQFAAAHGREMPGDE